MLSLSDTESGDCKVTVEVGKKILVKQVMMWNWAIVVPKMGINQG